MGAQKNTNTRLPRKLAAAGFTRMPGIIERAGGGAVRRFAEFFVVRYRNANTREGYARDIRDFADWCDKRGILDVRGVTPMAVAAFIEALGKTRSAPTVKRHLAAIRKLMDWLVTGHIIDVNPAWSVQGPKHVVHRGSTPVLSADEARQLMESIPGDTVVGLRDRAAIALMTYSFARVSAMCSMEVRDFFVDRRQACFRLHEKGGKKHAVRAHRVARIAMERYLRAAGLSKNTPLPLFQTIDRSGKLTGKAMTRNDAYRMVARRAKEAGLPPGVCCHSFRATGITEYMKNGGNIVTAAAIAGHSSTRTTQLYNRNDEDVPIEEIERIDI
jgi:site-specific recombinase XerD